MEYPETGNFPLIPVNAQLYYDRFKIRVNIVPCYL
jgi:hypothetical protein